MSAEMVKAVEAGQRIGDGEIEAALRLRDGCQSMIAELLEDYDALLTFSAPGEAPLGREVGNATVNRPWTMLGMPCVTVPAGNGPNGLPIGAQLVGARDSDVGLLQLASHICMLANITGEVNVSTT
jgi:Asp-tRNA(Asn)/Glu-tRNA(Gln) amidotransferase A subunit family amidase